VCHGIELPFVFHSVKPFYNFSAGEDDLSKRMVTYWTNFAKTANPNSPVSVQPTWPLYSQAVDQSMELTVPPTVQSGLRASYCNFWDSLGYSFGS
jgi:carboxylesterase type B